ncbi:hypothetical protein BDV40DRAFT_282902 [Aspergillus tamarii]|uniref:Uncharacterized protein n=1 Tax=Aspergillus tamarii TaxID=41984 RepID=A0A5N6UB17_ASPTM|nr:hypothetical protein BDV40DRAFT_282902 [Aspergillus tamarii]
MEGDPLATSCGFACSLGSLVAPHPPILIFCLWALSLPPAQACAFWVAPPAHAGHSSRSGLSCHCVCVSSSSLQTRTIPGCGLVWLAFHPFIGIQSCLSLFFSWGSDCILFLFLNILFSFFCFVIFI